MNPLPGPPPPIEGADHHYVKAGGLQVHYAEAGEGPPILLLHGWPQHHGLWRRVIARMRDRHRLIAPDLRGFGWTEAPGHGYDADTFASDQIALLDALGIERADVIGHDWGGWTAFLLGIDHSERIGRIVACNAPHPWPEMRPAVLARQLPRSWYGTLNAAPRLGAFMHARTPFVRTILEKGSRKGTFGEDELELFAAPFRDPARAAAASALYRYYLRLNTKGLRRIPMHDGRLSVPTLLLFGEKDAAISPELVRNGWQDHADEMTVEFADAGHFIVDEEPDLVAARAASFFSRNAG